MISSLILSEPLAGNAAVDETVIEVGDGVTRSARTVRAASLIRKSESSVSACEGHRTVPGVPWARTAEGRKQKAVSRKNKSRKVFFIVDLLQSNEPLLTCGHLTLPWQRAAVLRVAIAGANSVHRGRESQILNHDHVPERPDEPHHLVQLRTLDAFARRRTPAPPNQP